MESGPERERDLDAARRADIARLGLGLGLWRADDPIELVSRGTENTTFAVNGHIVRVAAAPRETDVGAEAALLSRLAGRTAVPVPEPLVCDPGNGILVYRALPGVPLIHAPRFDRRRVEDELTDLLCALRGLGPDLPLARDDHPLAAWHAEALADFAAVRGRLPGDHAAVIAAFLDEAPPADRDLVVPAHDDLGAEHVLVGDDGSLAGVIDWTDAAYADPAHDLARILRDLGPGSARAIADAIGSPFDAEELHRVRFHARCAWLEDVRYAFAAPTTRSAYLRNARRTFGWTFGDAT
jgi:aminoglycoside phosphotransferase (APT) family kinase protein